MFECKRVTWDISYQKHSLFKYLIVNLILTADTLSVYVNMRCLSDVLWALVSYLKVRVNCSEK